MYDENKWNESDESQGGMNRNQYGQYSGQSQNDQSGQNSQNDQSDRGGQNIPNGQNLAGGPNSSSGQSPAGGPNSANGRNLSGGQSPLGRSPYSSPYPYQPSGRQEQASGTGAAGYGTAPGTGNSGTGDSGAAGTGGYNGASANSYNGASANSYNGANNYNGTGGYNGAAQPGPGSAPTGGPRPPKKKSYLKTTALVTAAALLFGVVSGGTMFGVNRVANLVLPNPQAESKESLAQTETLAPSQGTVTANATGVVLEDVSPIVEAAMPSVVAITNTMLYRSEGWFGQGQTYEVPSSGSGIIVGQNDTELLIVTNNHVIADSNNLAVTFIDTSTVDAAVKGTDSESDLAVIAVPLEKISADTKSQIKAATLGDSDALKMGQGVIAIGNALGLGQSVTVGHVSALNREITVDGVKKTVIQTDAAINPGNSGGALLNSKGELIGINEAKYTSTEVEGVGYAIPISRASSTIDELKERTTKVEVAEDEQGYLGIQVQNIDSTTSKMYGMPQGAYVYKITENSAASASDLREMDIITAFDGEAVRSNADLTELLTYYKSGTTVTLTVQSPENGAYVERQVQVTLKSRPKEESQDANGQQPG